MRGDLREASLAAEVGEDLRQAPEPPQHAPPFGFPPPLPPASARARAGRPRRLRAARWRQRVTRGAHVHDSGHSGRTVVAARGRTKRAPRLSVSAKLHETPVHHHDPSSASGGPHLLSTAQLPRVKRAARFQRKLKRPRGALGRCAWGCGFIPAWHASSARSRRAVRAAIDHFAAVDQSGSAPHVRLLNTRYRGDFVALPSRWAPRHVAQEGPLYRVFKSRCTLGTGATSVAAGSSAVTPPFHTSCAGSVTRGGDN